MNPQENEQLIANMVTWLNEHHGAGWIPIQGLNTITKIELLANGGATFTPSSGYPLKAFVNTTTGEVKVFDARRFMTT